MAQFKPTHIMIHHSATEQGNADIFRRYHMSKGWRDIGYHFVICNGNGGKDGEIQKGRAETEAGAHCLEGNMNQKALAICLVGNFDDHKPSNAQYQSLVKLTRELMKKYNIPIDNIVMHRQYAINKATGKPYKSCPGWAFDLDEFKKMVIKEEVIELFKDIEGHWAKSSIERLAQLGIIRGDEQGNFNPDRPITRAEVVVLLDRLLKLLGR
ncbi:MAG: N-acetylmuramoyl-L-alanine amidase [Thermovenabulum sp.]|uniref:N-acetylmuramoyl-L-alanine amidase n=1 Tax=Thermovenabulum sp. TaxID=3100335 RepID=UPI003C7BEC8C